jgi:hypothetical protein
MRSLSGTNSALKSISLFFCAFFYQLVGSCDNHYEVSFAYYFLPKWSYVTGYAHLNVSRSTLTVFHMEAISYEWTNTLSLTWTQDSLVCIVTTLRAGRPRSPASIPSMVSRFFCSLKHPGRFWVHPASSVGTGVLYPGVKRPGCKGDQSPHLVRRLRMSGTLPPLFHRHSWSSQNLLPVRDIIKFCYKYLILAWLHVASVMLDRKHVGQCTALSSRAECERYWEARTKMMEIWLRSFSITISVTAAYHWDFYIYFECSLGSNMWPSNF